MTPCFDPRDDYVSPTARFSQVEMDKVKEQLAEASKTLKNIKGLCIAQVADWSPNRHLALKILEMLSD